MARTTPKFRSLPEIEAEIAKLISLRSKIIPIDLFGASNIDKIDAQIAVLRDRLTLTRIEEIYGIEGIDPDIQNEAIEAYEWMKGTSFIDSLSEVWECIVIQSK